VVTGKRAEIPFLSCDVLDEAIVNEIRAATNDEFVLGTARFQEKIVRTLGVE
jgi:hypothetical protein